METLSTLLLLFILFCAVAVSLTKDLLTSMKIAVENTCNCIKATVGDEKHWYGVKFEQCIPDLIKML